MVFKAEKELAETVAAAPAAAETLVAALVESMPFLVTGRATEPIATVEQGGDYEDEDFEDVAEGDMQEVVKPREAQLFEVPVQDRHISRGILAESACETLAHRVCFAENGSLFKTRSFQDSGCPMKTRRQDLWGQQKRKPGESDICQMRQGKTERDREWKRDRYRAYSSAQLLPMHRGNSFEYHIQFHCHYLCCSRGNMYETDRCLQGPIIGKEAKKVQVKHRAPILLR
jgi:hypothetical protein